MEINELAKALVAAQLEIENASKNSSNPHFKSKYADLAEVLNTVRPVFSKHGIAIVQSPSFDAGEVKVTTYLIHTSGQFMNGTLAIPIGKMDAQAIGSALTYARRYALAAFAGISQEDDDGNAAKASISDAKTEVEIVNKFKQAKDLNELSEVWNSLDVGIRKQYIAYKDAAKERISTNA